MLLQTLMDPTPIERLLSSCALKRCACALMFVFEVRPRRRFYVSSFVSAVKPCAVCCATTASFFSVVSLTWATPLCALPAWTSFHSFPRASGLQLLKCGWVVGVWWAFGEDQKGGAQMCMSPAARMTRLTPQVHGPCSKDDSQART